MTPSRQPSPTNPTSATSQALRLTVIVGESELHHHTPLFHEIVRRARDAGLAGASVFRGIEGFGGTAEIHTTRVLSLSEDLPVAVIIVDTEQRVRDFLPQVDAVVEDGLVLLEPVEVVRYAGERGGARP